MASPAAEPTPLVEPSLDLQAVFLRLLEQVCTKQELFQELEQSCKREEEMVRTKTMPSTATKLWKMVKNEVVSE